MAHVIPALQEWVIGRFAGTAHVARTQRDITCAIKLEKALAQT
jgi:hypothetical protein